MAIDQERGNRTGERERQPVAAVTPESQTGEGKRPPRQPRKKISWVAALVINMVTLLILLIILLAVLIPNYRRGAMLSKVFNGSENVRVEVITTEEAMRKNGTDVLSSIDRIKKVIKEMGAQNVDAFVQLKGPDWQQKLNESQGTNDSQPNP